MKSLRKLFLFSFVFGTMMISADAFAAESHSASIYNIANSAPTIKVVGSQVEISLAGDSQRQVVIYALTGQIVKSMTISPGTTVIDLPAGYYIIKCDSLSKRVVIR